MLNIDAHISVINDNSSPSTPCAVGKLVTVSAQVVKPVLIVRHLSAGPLNHRGRWSHLCGLLGHCCPLSTLFLRPPSLCRPPGPEGPPVHLTAASCSSGSVLMVCCDVVCWNRDWTLRFHQPAGRLVRLSKRQIKHDSRKWILKIDLNNTWWHIQYVCIKHTFLVMFFLFSEYKNLSNFFYCY